MGGALRSDVQCRVPWGRRGLWDHTGPPPQGSSPAGLPTPTCSRLLNLTRTLPLPEPHCALQTPSRGVQASWQVSRPGLGPPCCPRLSHMARALPAERSVSLWAVWCPVPFPGSCVPYRLLWADSGVSCSQPGRPCPSSSEPSSDVTVPQPRSPLIPSGDSPQARLRWGPLPHSLCLAQPGCGLPHTLELMEHTDWALPSGVEA